MTRGETKRLLRQATQMRIRAERTALAKVLEHIGIDIGRSRIEESKTREHLRGVPSVFAFAEKLNPRYDRPLWAGQRYGAK